MRSWPYTSRRPARIEVRGNTGWPRPDRKVLAAMMEAKARFHSRVVKAVTVGDFAQLYTDFEVTMNDDSAKTVAIRSKAIEVLRCQPDGTWKLMVGDPNGRE
jgi:ketosteroid isomerase-like protein